jgi:hypothetical protein
LLLPKLVSQVTDVQRVEHGDFLSSRQNPRWLGYQHVPILGKARNAAVDRRGDHSTRGTSPDNLEAYGMR